MNTQNFKLNDMFHENAREYVTRPVMAAKYEPGMENSWMVYFTNVATKGRSAMMHEGIKFFPAESDAWDYIHADEKQYIEESGRLVEIAVSYDPPRPVLCRKDADAVNKDGMHFCFGKQAFVSDESCDYEFYILECDCWIIQDMDNIRVWYPDSEETFFGREKEIVYEKAGNEEYIRIAV